MYKLSDTILHKNEGVCSVKEIVQIKNGETIREYFSLLPVYESPSNSSFLVLVDNCQQLKTLTPKEEVEKLYNELTNIEVDIAWINDARRRKDEFKIITDEADLYMMTKLYLLISRKKKDLIAQKKIVPTTDNSFSVFLLKLVSQEMSYTLEKPIDEVIEYLRSCI